jgi:hypothetical protein
MAFKTFTSGVDTNFSTELNTNFKYLPRFDLITQNVTSSNTTSSTQSLLATHTIDANTVTNGVIVFAQCTLSAGQPDSTADATAYAYLYIGSSSNFSTNTQADSVFTGSAGSGGSNLAYGNHGHRITMMQVVSSLDWTNNNYIQVSGKTGVAGSATATFDKLIVLKF